MARSSFSKRVRFVPPRKLFPITLGVNSFFSAAYDVTPDVETFALVSAIGASANSMFFYARTKGEVERDIQQIGFCSLTICRPSIIAGERTEMRIAEGAVLEISRALAAFCRKSFTSIQHLSLRHPCSIQFSQREPVAVGSLPKSSPKN